MAKKNAEPITTLVNEFFDSAGLTDSFLGQIAKGLITKTLSRYVKAGKAENLANTRLGYEFDRLSKKWSKRIFEDLSKLQISENERKFLLALFLASFIPHVISAEQVENDLAEE
ncbi:MAG: hypothetical protein QXU46_02160 [Candidatus Bathyarchaeia archaeon]